MAPSTKAPTKNGLLKPPSTASPAAMQRTPSGTLIVPRPHEKIYLFVPNLIGYARIVLALASLVYMGRHPKYCTVLYCISCLLDAFDGMAARALGQSTKFGAVLDMITDRYVLTSFVRSFVRSSFLSCLPAGTTPTTTSWYFPLTFFALIRMIVLWTTYHSSSSSWSS